MKLSNNLQNFARNNQVLLGALLIFFVLALIVNHLTVPNMLAGDKLDNELMLMKSRQPELFQNDSFYDGDDWHFFYIPFIDFLEWANQFTGSSEQTYRTLVPITWFIFAVGMFLLLTLFRVRFWPAIIVAVISTAHFPVLLEAWGIPGPSTFIPRNIGLALTLFAFILFFKFRESHKVAWAFFVMGLIGNIHPVTGFYGAMIMALSLWWYRGWRSLGRIVIYGLAAVLGILPFAIIHFLLFPQTTQYLPGSLEYLEAMRAAQPHINWPVMVGYYRNFFLGQWLVFWPVFAIFWLVIGWRRKVTNRHSELDLGSRSRIKSGMTGGIDRLSLRIVLVTILVTFVISFGQQLLQVFNISPILIEEPRAFRLIYIVLYVYLGVGLGCAWEYLKQKKYLLPVILIGTLLLLGGAFAFREKIISKYNLIQEKKASAETADTCRLPLYDWIKTNTAEDSLFLIDPDRYPPFRICTERSVVYTYRDSGKGIGSANFLVEWYSRRVQVIPAFENKEAQVIINLANTYGADYILSEGCIELDLEKLFLLEDEHCVYGVK
jgi:hypothetical protein